MSLLAMLLVQESADLARGTGEARWHVWRDYYLSDPGFLWFAPIALALLWYGRSRRGIEPGRAPSLPRASLPRTWAQRLGWIPPLLHAVALLAVIVCLARPVRGNAVRTTTSQGIDIVLVVDRSSSMKYPDLEENRTRLDVVKEVVGEFAKRRMTDRVGAADSCALVTFAQYPQLLCPFTLDESALSGFLKTVDMAKNEAEDGTAIGRGLAKAVALLKESDAKSKVVVLLTDGENNVHDIEPAEACDLAVEAGVKVYTVLAARFAFQEDIFGRIYPTNRELDATELEQIAEKTGGFFFRAKDRDALEAAYARVEELERTEREEQRYTETFDLYARLLLGALVTYVVAWISYATWARRLP